MVNGLHSFSTFRHLDGTTTHQEWPLPHKLLSILIGSSWGSGTLQHVDRQRTEPLGLVLGSEGWTANPSIISPLCVVRVCVGVRVHTIQQHAFNVTSPRWRWCRAPSCSPYHWPGLLQWTPWSESYWSTGSNGFQGPANKDNIDKHKRFTSLNLVFGR